MGLKRRQLPLRNGGCDIGQRREHAGCAVKRRRLEGHHPIAPPWRDAVEADADRRNVAPLGQLDGLADNLLRLAFKQSFREDGGFGAHAFRPTGRISALSRLKGHRSLLVVNGRTPACRGLALPARRCARNPQRATASLWRCMSKAIETTSTKKPGAVSRPGAAREFQFHE